jgi:hypothetical protein
MNFPTLPLDNTIRLIFYLGWFLLVYSTISLSNTNESLQEYGYQIDSIGADRRIDSLTLERFEKLPQPHSNRILDEKDRIFDRFNLSMRKLNYITHKIKMSENVKNRSIAFTIVGVLLVILTNRSITKKEKLEDDIRLLQYKTLLMEYEEKLRVSNASLNSEGDN